MKKIIIMRIMQCICVVGLVVALFCGSSTNTKELWESSLYTPTMIVKFENDYFIVDCWHHRVIYNDNLYEPISKWKLMTDDIVGSHTIAYDGRLYVVDDTGRGG